MAAAPAWSAPCLPILRREKYRAGPWCLARVWRPGLLGLPAGLYDSLRRRLVKDLLPFYAMLGIAETATDAEVKKAYRKLATEYHPDKIMAQGLPEDFHQFAEDKFKQINEAYESIMSSRQK